MELNNACPFKDTFLTKYFEKLAVTANLREQIIPGKTEKGICDIWEPVHSQYSSMYKKYLIYK